MKNSLSTILSALAIMGAVVLLAACGSTSESSSPRVKSESPWGKRTAAVTESAEAPAPASASEAYKQELDDTEIGSESGFDLGYQTERVESVVPADPLMEEPVEEPLPVASSPPVVKKTAPKPEPVVTANDTVAGDDNFKNISPGHYTLQVIASIDKNAVYTFARQHQLSTRYIVPTVRGGATWHVLLLDVYPNKAAAKSAMDAAAASLPTKPWIRTVASVQQLMP